MIRNKTLSLPLMAALAAGTALPASAQLSLGLSSDKTYRQNKNGVQFKGGNFRVRLDDGTINTINFCNEQTYFPPGFYVNSPCTPGSSGYLSEGVLNNSGEQRRYLLVTALQGATAIEPGLPSAIRLTAAPASGLPRPSGGFSDRSVAVYYNLHTSNVQEYPISRYTLQRNYNARQRGAFDRDIVTGVYQYSFPRLNRPEVPAPIKATVYPMPEGFAKKNNKPSGFRFTKVNKTKISNNTWRNKGFLELSFRRPNRVEWEGLNVDNVFSGVDRLFFSVRALRNPSNSNSDAIRGNEAIFPAFVNGSDDPRILLRNPRTKSFNIPPVIEPGTRAVIEVELERDFQTGAVTYDSSTRLFQIPVIVIDRYSEYRNDVFAKGQKSNPLQDADNDGFNNLTEWVLGSNASDSTSTPAQPEVRQLDTEDITGVPIPSLVDFGFDVPIRQGMVPAVVYTLQRSRDNGRTWTTFNSDSDWSVVRRNVPERGMIRRVIQVRSARFDEFGVKVRPDNTQSDLYRVKITLPKKKK